MPKLIVVAVACLLGLCVVSAQSDTIEHLLLNIQNSQCLKSKPYTAPLVGWERQAGVFDTNIHLNFRGNSLEQDGRRDFKIPDSDAFVMSWVLEALLDASDLDPRLEPADDVLLRSLNAIITYKDHNVPNVSRVCFWDQVETNYSSWSASPHNLIRPIDSGLSLADVLRKLLDLFGMHALAKDIDNFEEMIDAMVPAFRIPPDADDSFVNVALGAQLHHTRPDAWPLWASHFPNTSLLTTQLLEKAYRPFSDDQDASSLDPRSYFMLRGFLEDCAAKNRTDVILVTTWLETLSESASMFKEGVAMPFNVNNIG
jgi:hypothetical protein